MFFKHAYTLALLLALVALFSILSGCGSNVSGGTLSAPATSATAGNMPDSVQITIITGAYPPNKQPQVTLRQLAQVQQLYQTTLALPLMPQNIACTAEAGPHYQLVFLRGTHTLAQVLARREGCRPVTISGESRDRQTSPAFWTQLDQAIAAATPVPRPQALAIQHALQGNQPVQTARITDAATVQRLYSALLALPAATNRDCSDQQYPEYRLVFQTTNQAIPAVISQQCQSIELTGNYQSPNGTYSLTAQFKQLFTRTLADATFAPAQPDQLMKTVESTGTDIQGLVASATLTRQLYAKIFTLQASAIEPGCPSVSDKINGKARWYTLEFTQWSLPIMTLTVYEGSCKLIQPAPGLNADQTLLGDTAFWDLVHSVANA